MSLHIQQVTKSFNKTQALQEINLDIKDSEFVANLRQLPEEVSYFATIVAD